MPGTHRFDLLIHLSKRIDPFTSSRNTDMHAWHVFHLRKSARTGVDNLGQLFQLGKRCGVFFSQLSGTFGFDRFLLSIGQVERDADMAVG